MKKALQSCYWSKNSKRLDKDFPDVIVSLSKPTALCKLLRQNILIVNHQIQVRVSKFCPFFKGYTVAHNIKSLSFFIKKYVGKTQMI